MIEFAALTYGLLASFVLSSLGSNQRARRPHPAILKHIGYVLCGLSGGTSLILAAIAARLFFT